MQDQPGVEEIYDNEEERHEECKKQAADQSRIKITLQGSGDNHTSVLAKKHTKVGRLLVAYCNEWNVNPKAYRMIYKGKVLQNETEINAYNMAEGDTIEVVASQTGGSC